MGLLGGVLGGIGGFLMGGPVGAVAGAAAGYGAEEAVEGIAEALDNDEGKATVSYPPSVDYSAAMMVESDNAKSTALAQIAAQQFALQQASVDRQIQQAMSLELSLERFDVKLETAKLDYFAMMHSEENKHVEKMTATRRASVDADFPEPAFEGS